MINYIYTIHSPEIYDKKKDTKNQEKETKDTKINQKKSKDTKRH